ncbi:MULTISPECIES: hypothetical protein [unclassified Crossiella]|uniref:hypothetical protein n=1 Tax=unclassified Crossiella TaxID=2620835 RepID=UPI001FFE6688|nr:MULTISPECIES: hypothetical protein [unclassified Crossiella]MCK2241892.1 hypothetical protein [Crossiella sp. S99.2]MCK2255795.1 hypothetical protein [Crossiella sp. S99.1]
MRTDDYLNGVIHGGGGVLVLVLLIATVRYWRVCVLDAEEFTARHLADDPDPRRASAERIAAWNACRDNYPVLLSATQRRTALPSAGVPVPNPGGHVLAPPRIPVARQGDSPTHTRNHHSAERGQDRTQQLDPPTVEFFAIRDVLAGR